MFMMPGATFWRPWAVAAVLCAMAIGAFSAIDRTHAATMRASFYGAESGRVTASGRAFDPMGLTAAHRSWRFGTRLRVCLSRCATIIVTDRGPAAWTGRAIDLSRGAARAIGLEARGVAVITVNRLN